MNYTPMNERPEPEGEPLAIRLDRAAYLSAMSRNTLYRHAMAGRLRLIKAGRHTLVDYPSLKALVASLPAARLTNAA